MIENLNLILFHRINDLAGRSYALDNSMIFAANYFVYIFAFYLLYLWLMSSKNRQEVLFAGYAALLGLGINFVITLFYFHPRPFMIPIGKLLIDHASETSFPSDHTTILFSISLMLLTSRELRVTGMVSLILSFIGGFARIYVGVHFPMDIAGSLLVALFSVGLLSISKKYLIPLNSVIIVYFDRIVKKYLKDR